MLRSLTMCQTFIRLVHAHRAAMVKELGDRMGDKYLQRAGENPSL